MRSLPRLRKGLVWAGGLSLLLGAAACGDDEPAQADARPPDAAPGDAPTTADAEVDAGLNELRSGSIAVTEVRVTNNLGGLELSGAAVSIRYVDLTQPSTAPSVGSGGIGECTVWVYDVGTSPEPTGVDEGPFTITGTDHSPFACAFNAGLSRYVCAAASNETATGATAAAAGGGVYAYTLPGIDLEALNPRGMHLMISGFGDASDQDDPELLLNGVFPVIAENPTAASNTIYVLNPDGPTLGAPATADATYTLLVGEGPVPYTAAMAPLGVTGPYTSFLGAPDTEVGIAKAAGGLVPAYQTTVSPAANNFALDENSAQPHEVPSAAADVTFSCGGTGGVCPDSEGLLTGMLIFGETTDADLTGTAPYDMPDPVTQYATFQCRSNPGANSVTLTEAALAAILGTNPTRIQTTVLRIGAELGQPASSIAVGHGLVGFSNVTAGE